MRDAKLLDRASLVAANAAFDPATWIMVLIGLGLIGAGLRRQGLTRAVA